MGRTLLILIILFGSACDRSRPITYVEARPLMGTLVEITTADIPIVDARKAVAAAFERMRALSDTMNHYNANSLVSQINDRAGQAYTPVTAELFEVLKQAAALSERTEGAFDITIGSITGWRFDPERPAMPTDEALERMRKRVDYRNVLLDDTNHAVKLKSPQMRIDLGGIAKLYIIDHGMRELKARGVQAAMINGGGDIETLGKPAGKPWSIGIRDPWSPQGLYARLAMEEGFVVSSGDYERYFIKAGQRYHHVLDPRTGKSAQGLRQVTLIGKDLERINGLSAAIMVMGKTPGIALLGKDPTLSAILMDDERQVWTSSGLAERLQLEPAPNRSP